MPCSIAVGRGRGCFSGTRIMGVGDGGCFHQNAIPGTRRMIVSLVVLSYISFLLLDHTPTPPLRLYHSVDVSLPFCVGFTLISLENKSREPDYLTADCCNNTVPKWKNISHPTQQRAVCHSLKLLLYLLLSRLGAVQAGLLQLQEDLAHAADVLVVVVSLGVKVNVEGHQAPLAARRRAVALRNIRLLGLPSRGEREWRGT